jgi:intein/homing endonuclease
VVGLLTLAKVEEEVEIEINFREEVASGQGIRLTESYHQAGKITQIMFHFPPGCFLPGTPILMENNMEKMIEAVSVGERVLCHSSYGDVSRVFSRSYDGEIIVVKPVGSRALEVTPEHPFFCVKRGYRQYPKVKPQWIKAKDLKRGYWLISPVPTRSRNLDKIDLVEFIDFEGYDSEGNIYGVYSENRIRRWLLSKRMAKLPKGTVRYKYAKRILPRFVELSKTFLRLIGYYLAEGNINYDYKDYGENYQPPSHPVGVTFTFGIGEKDLAEDAVKAVRDSFGFTPSIHERKKKNKNTLEIEIRSVPIAKLFKKLCGEHYDKKRIHPILMSLPPEKQKNIIEGLHLGDNSDHPRENGILIDNTPLAHQVWIILNRLKRKPAHYQTGKQNIVVWRDQELSKKRFYFKNWLITPIAKILKKHYAGPVYNLEVKPYNSYVANKIAVHNCNGLVECRLLKDLDPFYPVKGFLALNNATPVYYVQAEYYANEPLTFEVLNRDSENPHTPTCTVVIRFKKPEWWGK